MNLRTALLFLFLLAGTPLLQAIAPLYNVKITPTKTFEFVAEPNTSDQLSFYPLTDFMRKPGGGRKVVAANYVTSLPAIRTETPAVAAQEILNQIGQQTGLMLRKYLNSTLTRVAPGALVQAVSDTAVITLVLTPKEKDLFWVACAYVIEERPEGSIDGTPAAIAQMEETMRLMTADSTVTSLPEKVVLKDIKLGDYFRGSLGFSLPDSSGQFLPVVVLMLKKGNDYTVGFYRNEDGLLTILDQPVALSGTRPPFLTNLPDQAASPDNVPPRASQSRTGLRANKFEGAGGYYIAFENGHVVKNEF